MTDVFHRFHALTCHPDVTRFEIEDGLVRTATASLLSQETTISSVIADVEIHAHSGFDAKSNVDIASIAQYNSSLLISSTDEAATSPEHLAELVAEVAVVGSSWRVSITELSELEKPWIGAATPGPKITVFANPDSAVDSPQYRSDIEELAGEVCAAIGDVGSRISYIDDGSAPFTTAISFWFASPRSAEAAVESGEFERMYDSALLESDSILFVESIEHRIIPNPNTWATTTGVEPPVVDQ